MLKKIVYSRKLVYCATGLFGFIALARLVKVLIKDRNFIDFLAYYDVSKTVRTGLNPYILENLSHQWGEPPMVFPGYSALFYPFTFLSSDAAGYVFLLLNAVIAVGLFYLLFKKKGLMNKGKTGLLDSGFLLSLFVFMSSTPYFASINHGQSTIFVSFFLISLLLIRPFYLKVIFFAAAAVLKYSMLPLFGPVLFLKKRHKLCICSFVLFLVFGAVPMVFGHNLIELYSSYVDNIFYWVNIYGFNSYEGGGYNMLQLDFIAVKWLQISAKTLCGAIFIYSLYLSRKDKDISMHLIFLTACLTMLISYHRLYDLVFILPFALYLINIYLRKQEFFKAAVTAGFVGFFIVPESIIYRAAEFLGSFVKGNSIVYLTSFNGAQQYQHMFPVYPIVCIFLSIWAFYLFVARDKNSQNSVE
ncbi:hypothetical protein L21SP3_00695 [Sedimentisphaera cyanobacteriorum]|uniref:Uncharacterized protein n=1 Tax=Sedimentisphaera cyanobacteriorum TaxID=1940790 RepID=A0A1Q2HN80_9BACT|nr:glycosyltransferase 87 family protein [Sedimentisphaera cyanobacteriorum]AQQ08902.1 hypothetical protein L21SP3_00695 [Sedimentisphaera cyanobacteriorum]